MIEFTHRNCLELKLIITSGRAQREINLKLHAIPPENSTGGVDFALSNYILGIIG
jgi:hypothetical protein